MDLLYKKIILIMGTYLSQPKIQKKTQLKRFDYCYATTCQMQGWRKNMEDAILCQQICQGVNIFGVFDGHGGPQVSLYVSRVLSKQLIHQPNFKNKNYSKALINTFKKIDENIKSAKGQEQLNKIHNQLKLPPDEQNVQPIGYRAGCTANVILLTKQKIIVANIGDSRSVLCRKGVAVPLSEDHKPQNAIQRQRVNASGGYIKNGRINGGINLSRAFGDYQYKSVSSKKYDQQPIISVPDIKQFVRSKQDSFIVMGCDGVWQKYSTDNQKMIDYINQLRNKCKDKKILAQTFLDSLLGKNTKQPYGLDNMSVIFLDFV